ncbi:MAG: hypothetical protein AAFQ95_19440 [Cyanobacteria bacterium J06621_3]
MLKTRYWKPLTAFLIGLLAVLIATYLLATPSQKDTAQSGQQPVSTDQPLFSATLQTSYDSHCLSPTQADRPVWECYQIPTPGLFAHQAVQVRHDSGKQYKVLTFEDQNQTVFRFTPTQKGTWTFSNGDQIDINRDRPAYAKGFVTAKGNKWIRSATDEAFVPQFVMYDKPDLDAGLNEFVDGHGFTGFHVINLRDFLKNPSYFEAVVLKTYRRGGTTHFWIWGDDYRKLTPSTYDVDVDLLYTEIAARLAPLPGWSLGYGFDLFEWSSAKEIENFRAQLRRNCSYHHLIGGRGHKSQYREISSKLDYAAWEWLKPSYTDYREHIEQANGRPAFSEDRFRIWPSKNRPNRAYDPELTFQGLWNSAMAGGVANIWGHQPNKKQQFSAPYLNKAAIKTYSTVINQSFTADMEPDNSLITSSPKDPPAYCLKDSGKQALCYAPQTSSLQLNLESMELPIEAIAVDIRKAYEAIELSILDPAFSWQAPYESGWAIMLHTR